ncbi:uncharacterized protein LOC133666474 [Apis cerana]|uniref:uncharacterized protein LOC133666474 n=1 Tax=Apis cerana TaxID=7461 RepID=UPI002B221B72|nr:uncharacterized protein LOC133666474 [Apis cerana]
MYPATVKIHFTAFRQNSYRALSDRAYRANYSPHGSSMAWRERLMRESMHSTLMFYSYLSPGLSLFTSIIHHKMDVETVIFTTKACSAPRFHSPREKTLLQALYLSTRWILSTLESKLTLDILKNWRMMPIISKKTRGD